MPIFLTNLLEIIRGFTCRIIERICAIRRGEGYIDPTGASDKKERAKSLQPKKGRI